MSSPPTPQHSTSPSAAPTSPSTAPTSTPTGRPTGSSPGTPPQTPQPTVSGTEPTGDPTGTPVGYVPMAVTPPPANTTTTLAAEYDQDLASRMKGAAPGSVPNGVPAGAAPAAPGSLGVAPHDLYSFGTKVAGIHDEYFAPGKAADPVLTGSVTDIAHYFGYIGNDTGLSSAYGGLQSQVMAVLQEIQYLLGQLPEQAKSAAGTYQRLDESIAEAMRQLGAQ